MVRKASVMVALAGLAALALSSTAGAGGTVVYAPKDCIKPKVEPKRITLACGDADTLLKHLSWSDWNTEKAKGRGQLWVNDCDPNCSAGSFDKYDAKVKLLNIQTYACGGRTLPMYRRVHIRFPNEAPPHQGNLRSFKLFCNS